MYQSRGRSPCWEKRTPAAIPLPIQQTQALFLVLAPKLTHRVGAAWYLQNMGPYHRVTQHVLEWVLLHYWSRTAPNL